MDTFGFGSLWLTHISSPVQYNDESALPESVVCQIHETDSSAMFFGTQHSHFSLVQVAIHNAVHITQQNI
jgi:hypothetical protein